MRAMVLSLVSPSSSAVVGTVVAYITAAPLGVDHIALGVKVIDSALRFASRRWVLWTKSPPGTKSPPTFQLRPQLDPNSRSNSNSDPNSKPAAQRPMDLPTAGGLSWWLWPLRGGHGRGLRRFAALVAEVFAPSWWSRRRSFIHRHKNNAKIASNATSAFFITGTCLGFAPLRGTCAARRFFRRNHRKKEEKNRKKATSTGRGRWSCGGLCRAALEGTAVFCGHGRWLWAAVFLGFSIWRLKCHNP